MIPYCIYKKFLYLVYPNIILMFFLFLLNLNLQEFNITITTLVVQFIYTLNICHLKVNLNYIYVLLLLNIGFNSICYIYMFIHTFNISNRLILSSSIMPLKILYDTFLYSYRNYLEFLYYDDFTFFIINFSSMIEDCYICYDTFQKDELKCKYFFCNCKIPFHKTCLLKWLYTNDICPICRKNC